MSEKLSTPEEIIAEMQKRIDQCDQAKVERVVVNPEVCHHKDDLKIKLVERSSIIDQICMLWTDRRDSFNSLSLDRTRYKLPVCTGNPGVGKTRLLEEFRYTFGKMNPPIISNILGVLVLYFNGHGICDIEKQYSIESTFSWRLLHRYFLGNLVGFRSFMDSLQNYSGIAELKLANVIGAVCLNYRTKTVGYDESRPISVFIGVDEYQTISSLDDERFHETNKMTTLEKLVNLLYECSLELSSDNIHLYTMFAGTEWHKISATASSNVMIRKISVPFMSLKGCCRIADDVYPNALRSGSFKQCLFTIGDIARNAVEFATESKRTAIRKKKEFLQTKDLISIRCFIEDTNCRQWKYHISRLSLIRLVAFSLSGIAIIPSNVPSPEILLINESQMSWQQLADRGFLSISSSNSKNHIFLPYLAIKTCASYYDSKTRSDDNGNIEALIENAFLQNLDDIIRLLDDQEEQWRQWEKFGAIFHCLRINSLLVLGYDSVLFRDLFAGSNIKSQCHRLRIKLLPAYIFNSEDELSVTSDLANIRQSRNITYTENLMDNDKYFAVINGCNGKAVDIYMLFRTVESENHRYVLFLDQRKRDSTSITSSVIRNIQNNMMNVIPSNLKDKCIVITGLFSALASYGETNIHIPDNCFVFTRKELSQYHMTLANHVAALYLLDPHLGNKSLLKVALGNNQNAKLIAKYIIELRKTHQFLSFKDLNSKLMSTYNISISDDYKNSFFFPLSNDDESDDDDDDDDDEESEEVFTNDDDSDSSYVKVNLDMDMNNLSISP